MFTQLINNNTNLTTRQFNAKYIIPVFVAGFLILLAGQLAVQFFTVNQLNKASGKVTNMETQVTSQTHKHGSNKYEPDYSLVLTLDNGQKYYIQNVALRGKLDSILHVNDPVIIYSLGKALKLLSANLMASVPQIELGGKVIYSFDEEKHRSWLLITMFSAGAIAFGMMRYFFKK